MEPGREGNFREIDSRLCSFDRHQRRRNVTILACWQRRQNGGKSLSSSPCVSFNYLLSPAAKLAPPASAGDSGKAAHSPVVTLSRKICRIVAAVYRHSSGVSGGGAAASLASQPCPCKNRERTRSNLFSPLPPSSPHAPCTLRRRGNPFRAHRRGGRGRRGECYYYV